MNAPQMHSAVASASQSACRYCGASFTQRRAWQAFCGPKCRNAFHLAESHKQTDERLSLISAVLAHVAQHLGGDPGQTVAGMDPKAVLAAVKR